VILFRSTPGLEPHCRPSLPVFSRTEVLAPSTINAKALPGEPPSDSLRGKRDWAVLALLAGCGLRRAELVGLGTEDFQVREEHWVIADLMGKGNHIRTVPVPVWAKRAVDEWIMAGASTVGRSFGE
jgi:site-specific recombinase XerC